MKVFSFVSLFPQHFNSNMKFKYTICKKIIYENYFFFSHCKSFINVYCKIYFIVSKKIDVHLYIDVNISQIIFIKFDASRKPRLNIFVSTHPSFAVRLRKKIATDGQAEWVITGSENTFTRKCVISVWLTARRIARKGKEKPVKIS